MRLRLVLQLSDVKAKQEVNTWTSGGGKKELAEKSGRNEVKGLLEARQPKALVWPHYKYGGGSSGCVTLMCSVLPNPTI